MAKQQPVNVICMKWGTKFPAEDVNILYRMVKRHLKREHRFVCLTDDVKGLDKGIEALPLPEIKVPAHKDHSPWRKLGLLSKNIHDLKGWALFLDLDVSITGNLDDLFTYAQKQNKLTIIENWTQPGRNIGNSSVYAYEIGRYHQVLSNYEKNMEEVFKGWTNEQSYLCQYIHAELGGLAYWPADWCQSFKIHCQYPFPLNYLFTPKQPVSNCRVLVFHGDPKPDEAIRGGFHGKKWSKKIRKYSKPAPWIAKNYK